MVLGLNHGGALAAAIANIKDDNGVTALHFAAAGGKTHVCKYLIEELKLDVNMKDGKGMFSLLLLCLSQA